MATRPDSVTDTSQEVTQQRRYFAKAVGDATQPSVVQDILEFAADATLPPFYNDPSRVREVENIWYEMLVKDGLPEKVKDIARTWVQASSEFNARQRILLTVRSRTKLTLNAPKSTSGDRARSRGLI